MLKLLKNATFINGVLALIVWIITEIELMTDGATFFEPGSATADAVVLANLGLVALFAGHVTALAAVRLDFPDKYAPVIAVLIAVGGMALGHYAVMSQAALLPAFAATAGFAVAQGIKGPRHGIPFAISGFALAVFAILLALPMMGDDTQSLHDPILNTYVPNSVLMCLFMALGMVNLLWYFCLDAQGEFRAIWCWGSSVTLLPVTLFAAISFAAAGRTGMMRGSFDVPDDLELAMGALFAAQTLAVLITAVFSLILYLGRSKVKA